MLHASIEPVSSPLLNQDMRCCDVPWVKESGETWPVDIPGSPLVATSQIRTVLSVLAEASQVPSAVKASEYREGWSVA